MAGPDRRAPGGGPNVQCLPSDPEYSKTNLNAVHSALTNVIYSHGGKPTQSHFIPCAVCETNQRINKLMIPAKSRCPSDDWVLEYDGILHSSATQYSDGNLALESIRHRLSYECIDSNMESLNGRTSSNNFQSAMHAVKAQCTGEQALVNSCPPYQSDKPLSCVVCSK